MRMHAVRAAQCTKEQRVLEGALRRDTAGNFASAALPLFLGTFGMALLSVGAVMSLLPLVFAGVGLAVVGFAVYLIASGMDRADRRAAGRKEDRAARARAEFQQDMQEAPLRPRSPLADHAVAALTGEGDSGGIWPPLSSQPKHTKQQEGPVQMWAPGEKVSPPGWDEEEVVEFEDARVRSPRPTMHTDGQVSFHEATMAPPAPLKRPETARPDPQPDTHDFRVWPGAKDLDGWTTFTGDRKPQSSRFSEEEIKKAMDERRRQIAGKLPTVGAILADVGLKESEVERLRREATRGKCSQCEAVIWAPKKRPIVLKCPGCGHKAKLY